MNKLLKYVLIINVLSITGCAALNNSSKYNFADGYYYSRLNNKKTDKYYVVTGIVYGLQKRYLWPFV